MVRIKLPQECAPALPPKRKIWNKVPDAKTHLGSRAMLPGLQQAVEVFFAS